jgi:BirA family transcriptional regulator, biotin operon repressor / biotin---[acetyl-CoA-carboxylase] ligase
MIDIEFIRKKIPNTGFIRSVYYFDEIGSTNEFASSLKNEDGVLVIAELQSKGKGRLGRKWESMKGKNLTFSVKKNFSIPYSENSMITFFFSYFVYSAIIIFLQEEHPDINSDYLHIKWPNDIMYEDKKLCGLLIESKNNGKDYIIGIGLNVNQEVFPKEIKAVSLKLITDKTADLNNLLVLMINEFDKNIHLLKNAEFDKIFDLWRNSTKLIGKICEFLIDNNHRKRGIIRDLHRDGSIRIFCENKELIYFSGEIRLLGFAASKARVNPKIT